MGGRPRTPGILVVLATVATAFLALPLIAMVVLAPWRELPDLLGSRPVAEALRLSVVTATVAAGVCLILGVPLAAVLSRSTSRLARLIRAIVTVPLVLPPVVGGVALLLAYGRTGVVGRWLYAATGWQIPFSTVAVVLAQTFVALPFMVVTIEGALRASGEEFEEAAATLGAGQLTVFRTVTLPLIGPSIAAGTVLSWARALGEFGATVTFAGNLPGVTQAMPGTVYRAFETDPPSAVALSLVLLGVCVGVLLLLRDRWKPGISPW